eukprot:scaffold89094_cov57-Phaeocystis_antarctica.AAC.1
MNTTGSPLSRTRVCATRPWVGVGGTASNDLRSATAWWPKRVTRLGHHRSCRPGKMKRHPNRQHKTVATRG